MALFGLPTPVRPPALVRRTVLKWLVLSPERLQLPVAGLGEMVGCTLFRALRDEGLRLFAEEPAVAARIPLLYDEILGDEITHVGYLAAVLGSAGRAAMRALYRRLAPALVAQMPEMVILFGRPRLGALARAPFQLGAMVAELPGRAYAARSP